MAAKSRKPEKKDKSDYLEPKALLILMCRSVFKYNIHHRAKGKGVKDGNLVWQVFKKKIPSEAFGPVDQMIFKSRKTIGNLPMKMR